MCNTIYIFISSYSVVTIFLSPLLLNMGQTFFSQIQVRFPTEDTLWRGLETEQPVQNYLDSIIQIESLLPMFSTVCGLLKGLDYANQGNVSKPICSLDISMHMLKLFSACLANSVLAQNSSINNSTCYFWGIKQPLPVPCQVVAVPHISKPPIYNFHNLALSSSSSQL